MLAVQDLHVGYGSLTVLKNVSIHVRQGETVCLIGANGAGKTTLLHTISGLLRPSSGTIELDGNRIHLADPARIVSFGIIHVPEGRQIFSSFTVQENLEIGAYLRIRNRDKVGVRRDMEKVLDLFPRLSERKMQLAGTLSGGEQQMLAIARALMGNPRLLLLDEPSLGLAPKLVDVIFETVKRLNADGMTILIVEQNAKRALEIAHRGYVMETGRIILQGPAEDLKQDADIQRAYLGMDYRSPAER